METKQQTLIRYNTGEYEPIAIKTFFSTSYYLKHKITDILYIMRHTIGKKLFEENKKNK